MQLPEHLRGRNRPRITEDLAAGLGGMRVPFVSIKGNAFHLIDGTGQAQRVTTYDQQTGPYLECCIVATNRHQSRIYYAGPYEQDSKRPPDCFSDNGVAPSAQAVNPQSPTCQICPNAVWGSATSALGKPVPACRTYKKLAVVVRGYRMAFQLLVPPGSLKAFQSFVDRFVHQPNIDSSDVITRVSFVQGSVGLLQFQPMDYLDTEMADLRDAARSQTDQIIGKLDRPRVLELAGSENPRPDEPKHPTPVDQPAPQPAPPSPAPPHAPPHPETPPQQARKPGRPPKTTPQPGATAPFASDAPQFGVGQAPPPPGELQENLQNYFDR